MINTYSDLTKYYVFNQTNLLLNLNFKDCNLLFISRCCYNLDVIVDSVIDTLTLDNSELYY